jgi:hypothetical protein
MEIHNAAWKSITPSITVMVNMEKPANLYMPIYSGNTLYSRGALLRNIINSFEHHPQGLGSD